MRRAVWLGSLTLLCLALILSGCGGGGGGTADEKASGMGRIEGYVTAARGDYARSGAIVSLQRVTDWVQGTYRPASLGLSSTRLTASNGYYAFDNLSPGTYMLTIDPYTAGTQKVAGSRYQEVQAIADLRTRADLIAADDFGAITAVGIPYIDSIVIVPTDGGTESLLQANQPLSGMVRLRVTAQPSLGGPPIKLILVRVGHRSNGADFKVDNGEASGEFDYDTTKLGNGNSFIYVITYDWNDNSAAVEIPLTIAN